MVDFPKIKSDFYQSYKKMDRVERFAATISIKPPVDIPRNSRSTAQSHSNGYYGTHAIVKVLRYTDLDTGVYAELGLRIFSNLYKSMRVEQIYEKDDCKKIGVQKLKRMHQIEVAKSVAILGIAIIFGPVVHVVMLVQDIGNGVTALYKAIQMKDRQAIVLRVVKISIDVFELVTIFYPDPIAKIVLISAKVLFASYNVYKVLNNKDDVREPVVASLPNLVVVAYQLPRLMHAVEAVIKR